MSHYITKFSKNLNNIVDLGCGFGSKSLALIKKKAFYKKSFLLIDIAPNGIEIIKLLIKSTKKIIPKIKLEVSDFYEQKNIKTKIPINSLVFTSYSLHYKKKLNEKFLKLILRIKPKFVIHFEPIYEHYNKNTKSHKKIREYILENNYSLNLLSILKKYEKQKKIKIIYEKKNVFGVNKLLPFSIIVWQRSN